MFLSLFWGFFARENGIGCGETTTPYLRWLLSNKKLFAWWRSSTENANKFLYCKLDSVRETFSYFVDERAKRAASVERACAERIGLQAMNVNGQKCGGDIRTLLIL